MSYDFNFNIFNSLKDFVVIGLGEVPVIGWLLEGLAEILWPESSADVWNEIKDDVEALINQELEQFTYGQVMEDLQGVQNLLQQYINDKTNSPDDQQIIYSDLEALINQCITIQPHFADWSGNSMNIQTAVILLPMLAQLANIHLGAYRDLFQFAAKWNDAAQQLKARNGFLAWEPQYSNWVAGKVSEGKEALVPVTKNDPHNTINWNAQNTYQRSMQLSVLDFQQLWPAFDPAGTVPTPLLTREVYSDALGTSDEGPVQTTTNQSLATGQTPLTQLQIWQTPQFSISTHIGHTIQGILPSYGSAAGLPMGITNTGPADYTVDLSNSYPVVGVYVMSGDLFNAFQLLYQDGSLSEWYPQSAIPAAVSFCGYDGHMLSSITVMGISGYYSGVNATNCVVFGFRPINSYSPLPQKLFTFPAFTNVSKNQAALPFYVVHKVKNKVGDCFDFFTTLADSAARQADGFNLLQQTPLGFLLPDNSLYPDALPVYRMVAHDDSDRVMLGFSQSFYENQLTVGWDGYGLLGYMLQNTSNLPSIPSPQTITTMPAYILNAEGSDASRTSIAWTQAEYESALTQGWSDAGWPTPVGYVFNAS